MPVANSIGYSTYSDRPGTGWFGFHPNFSVQSVEFLGSFVLLTAYMSALSLIVPALMLMTAGVRRSPLPRWALMLILTPLFVVAIFYLLAAAGWYIAIDGVFIIVGTVMSVPFSIAISSASGLPFGRFRIRAF